MADLDRIIEDMAALGVDERTAVRMIKDAAHGRGSALGDVRTLAAARRNGLGALIDPTGKPWNNSTYQACIANAFTQAGAPPDQNADPSGYAIYMGILEAAQQNCIAKAGAGATSSSGILTLQRKINALLKANGYCPTITEDGKIGPQTCGAAAWASGIDGSVNVPTQCSQFTPMAQAGFLKDPPCAGAANPPVTPPVPPAPEPAPAASHKSLWGLLLGVGVAGLALVGISRYEKKHHRGRR